jgi:choline dehydrogenase-like flavoprotein
LGLVSFFSHLDEGLQFHDQCRELRNRLLRALDVRDFDPNTRLGYANQRTPHHAGGSLRLSDDGPGVLDVDLRFDGLPNIFACDVSVFPAIPAANESVTLAALSLRLAKHLSGLLHPEIQGWVDAAPGPLPDRCTQG